MERSKPQAFQSTYAPRLRAYHNSLLTPVLPSAPSGPISRTTKRGTTIINYAEDGFDDLDDDSDDPRRRPTGLRSLRKEDSASRESMIDRAGKETREPVDVQGIWRDWMGKHRFVKSDQQNAAQASLPLTLIPIRIDLDVPQFIPAAPFPPAEPQRRRHVHAAVPPGRADGPLQAARHLLLELARDAHHYGPVRSDPRPGPRPSESRQRRRGNLQADPHPARGVCRRRPASPVPYGTAGPYATSAYASADWRRGHARCRPDQRHHGEHAEGQCCAQVEGRLPHVPGERSVEARHASTDGGPATPTPAPNVTAEATPILPDSDDYNPDDTYRCVVNLNLNLASMLYTDKFEWSLLHPPGTAEAFAKVTCADLGLTGEWIPAMTHAIYEAVLRLKKEACEAGGLVGGWGGAQQDLPNDAANGAESGWRYDPDHLADDWEPKVEILSKEEMEKREGDRERQVRRLRRETARFSSTAGMLGGTPFGAPAIDFEEERMGRGERSKKKRRFRSLSPLGRGGTPGGRGTPDVGGYGGGGALTDAERTTWRCSHCRVWGTSVWAVRDGPAGSKTLCANCGYLYERDRRLPRQTKNLHLADARAA
ncbi:hypothetical protein ACCO45_000814 [Purpureocillium lilacinum]|uniref:Uncharacterized protein n=1 Tax=Purpureocillium lilacinum TaxID=33203 RepID=A0ACC4E586_PURLI